MTIQATLRIEDITLPCYIGTSTDAAVPLSRFESVEELRTAIKDEFNYWPQSVEDNNGEVNDWSDNHWQSFNRALESDIDDAALSTVNDAIGDIESANGMTMEELDDEGADSSYIYLSISFEDDGIPDDDERHTFMTIDALGAFASALINGDRSSLDDSDIPHVDAIESHYGAPVDCKSIGFGTCEITGLGGDLERYSFMYPRNADGEDTAPQYRIGLYAPDSAEADDVAVEADRRDIDEAIEAARAVSDALDIALGRRV